jgi:hypothetical protein
VFGCLDRYLGQLQRHLKRSMAYFGVLPYIQITELPAEILQSNLQTLSQGVKHRVAGGAWPLKGEGNEIVWARCGPSVRQLLHEHPILQRLLGWKSPEVRRPGSYNVLVTLNDLTLSRLCQASSHTGR